MNIIATTLAGLSIGHEVTFGGLTVAPIVGPDGRAPGYRTLDEALAQGHFHIQEVSEHGSVPELKAINELGTPVLLLDGEELVGAKQNRIVNLTILVPAQSTIVIPVSCVEAGRWHHASLEFAAAPRTQFAEGRARKTARVTASLEELGERHADQGEVWDGIAMKAARLDAQGPTGAMANMFERHEHSIEEYVRSFTATADQVGAVFGLNGHVAGLDLFDCAATFRKVMPKLIRSYAIDAIDAGDTKASGMSEASAKAFLRDVAEAEVKAFRAVGAGSDFRLKAQKLAGGGLVVDDRLIHLAAFRVANGNTPESGLSRASRRQRLYRE